MKFAEAHGHFATAAKLLEEEIGEKGPTQAQETQIIKVVEGEGGGRKGKGKEEGEGERNRGRRRQRGREREIERERKTEGEKNWEREIEKKNQHNQEGGKWKVEANDLNMREKGR